MCGGGGGEIKETPEQKELARIATERWEYAQREFAPYQKMYMDKVEGINTDRAFKDVAGKAQQGYTREFGRVGQEAQRTLAAGGVDPTSGKFSTAMGGLDRDQATATADGVSRSQVTQSDRYVGGLENIVAMGQGKATSAQAGLGDVARASGQDAANAAFNSFNRRQEVRDLVGTGLGMAARGVVGAGGKATNDEVMGSFSRPGVGAGAQGLGSALGR